MLNGLLTRLSVSNANVRECVSLLTAVDGITCSVCTIETRIEPCALRNRCCNKVRVQLIFYPVTSFSPSGERRAVRMYSADPDAEAKLVHLSGNTPLQVQVTNLTISLSPHCYY